MMTVHLSSPTWFIKYHHRPMKIFKISRLKHTKMSIFFPFLPQDSLPIWLSPEPERLALPPT